jgi:hypothetical protein
MNNNYGKLRRSQYEEVKGDEAMEFYSDISKKKQRWCKNHPTSFWGEGYSQCVTGFKLKEKCEVGK